MENYFPILVTGAEGFTGKFVCQELLKRGIPFKASIKPGKSKKWFIKRGIKTIETDVLSKKNLTKSLSGCKSLINLTSIGFGAVPVIIKSCIKAKVKRVVFISSTAIFTSLNAKSKKIRIDSENLIKESELAWTIIRPTMIYGTEQDRNMIRLIKFVDKFRFFPIFGNGKYLQQPVFVKDLAWVIIEVINNKRSKFKAINISGKDFKTFIEIIDIIGSNLNKRIFKLFLPKSPFIFILNFIEKMFHIYLPVKSEQIQRLNENKNFSNEIAKEILMYNPISIEEGLNIEITNFKKRND